MLASAFLHEANVFLIAKDTPLIRSAHVFLFLIVGALLLAGCNPIRQMHTQNQMLKARVEQMTQDKEVSDAAIKDHEATVAKMQSDLDAAHAETADMRVRLDNLTRTLSSGNQAQADAIARDLAERTARENELRLEVDRLRAADEMADTRVMKAEAEAKVATEAAQALRDELAEARQRIAQFETEATTAQAKIGEFEASLAALQKAEQDERQAAEALAAEQKTRAEAALSRRRQATQTLRAGLAPSTTVEASLERPTIRIVLPTDTLFQTGTVLLSDDGKQIGESLAKSLAQIKPARVEVVGHTDSIPVKNMPFVDNWDLGAARAASLARALDDSNTPVSASSRAALDPVASNDTPEGRRQNRRVEVILYFAE